MIFFLAKVLVSAILIAVVSEISKRSSIWAATLASLPLVSILSMVWIYAETGEKSRIATLSNDIFWLVLPSLAFFLVMPVLLKLDIHFVLAMAIAIAITLVLYAITLFALR